MRSQIRRQCCGRACWDRTLISKTQNPEHRVTATPQKARTRRRYPDTAALPDAAEAESTGIQRSGPGIDPPGLAGIVGTAQRPGAGGAPHCAVLLDRTGVQRQQRGMKFGRRSQVVAHFSCLSCRGKLKRQCARLVCKHHRAYFIAQRHPGPCGTPHPPAITASSDHDHLPTRRSAPCPVDHTP